MTGASSNKVERVEMGELTCWRVHGAHGELLITQQGAQILEYREHGQQPLIWLSEQAALKAGQSVRGGVPVCWPWFGDLARNPQSVQAMHDGSVPASAHGLVRGIDWQLGDIREGDGEIVLSLSCPTDDLPGWPLAPELTFEIRLGKHLRLELINHNRSDRPLALSQALHTYFAIGDIHQVRVEGLDGCRYLETLENWQERRQQGDVTFGGETDRVYLDVPGKLHIEDPAWQRRIHIHATGSSSAVVWNPWIDKSQRLSQFADDAWQRMLCIETAKVADDVLQLAPGESHRMQVEYWSEPLQG